MRYHSSLRAVYADLNARFWAGALPPTLQSGFFYGGETRGVQVRRIPVSATMRHGDGPGPLTRGLRVRGAERELGMCFGRFMYPGVFAARIHVLSPLTETHEREVLAHEMCHYAVFLAGIEASSHGPRFIAELTRIGAQGEPWALEQAERYRGSQE